MLLIDRPWVIGHRGFPSRATENTILSFDAALAAGARGIECDVRLTKDGHAVVFHDDSTRRLLGVQGRIEDLTRDEVRSMTFVGEPAGIRVPDLEDALILAEERGAIALIELKGDPCVGEELSRATLAAVERTRTTDRVAFLSFSHAAVATLHELAPLIPCAPIFEHLPHPESVAFHAHASRYRWVVVSAQAATKPWADELRSRSWVIGCYGVDDVETDLRMDAMGVGLRISDHVDLLVAHRTAA